jgi:probable F420-dependent oxidoreductase
MARMRPFQFLIASRDVVDASTLVERARWAESIGCTHIAIHDHLGQQLAPVPLLTAVAMTTERMRLCPLVFNNDLRHPAVLAQELASLDILSGGRVDVGLGAGWNEPEYRATGIEYDRASVRIDRLEEAITIVRGLFAEGPFSFAGRHYTITDLDGRPKPVQKPHPPFLIGGTRERVLRLASREADIVGIDLRQQGAAILDAFPERMDVRVGWIREEAGPRLARLDLSVLRLVGDITITDRAVPVATEVARALGERTGQAITPTDVLESPFSLIGTIDGLAEKLVAVRERWAINSFLVGWFDEPAIRSIAPLVERLSGR